MPGILQHSCADILRRVLIALDLGTDPTQYPNVLGEWPVYVDNEPSDPDNVLTVYDTSGRDGGRTMYDGERQENHGFQVRIRSSDHKTGFTRARAIAVTLDRNVYDEVVTLDGTAYLVHAVSRTSDVIRLGKAPGSKRSLFTINALATGVRQLS